MKYIYNILYLPALVLLLGTVIWMSGCEEEEANPSPQAAFEIDPSSMLQQDSEIKFINTSENAFSYVWSFGDGNVFEGVNATHTYAAPGDYEVTLEASGNGQRSLARQTITIAPLNFELVFIDNDALKLRKISLSDPATVVDVFDLPGFCFGLAYDATSDRYYFTDDDAGTLWSNTGDGSDLAEVATGFGGPRDIALQTETNTVFLADRSNDEVVAIDLTTGNKNTIYSVSDNALFLLPVGVDLYDNTLYMTAVDFDAETVWKGPDDGSGLTRIIDYFAGGFGYGIEVDEVNETIYFDDNDGGQLLRADLDGSNIITIGNTTDRVYGIAIENQQNKVYWAGRDGFIYAANLDGSEDETIADIGADVRGMIIRQAN